MNTQYKQGKGRFGIMLTNENAEHIRLLTESMEVKGMRLSMSQITNQSIAKGISVLAQCFNLPDPTSKPKTKGK